ncbi:sensor histidine kinase [Cellulomonas bogoriensis]|uniref:sensor histidine kinase n=1 Tax=Cellulomonas bogoriensis TaxID=301388 RepID=UPI000AA64EC7|nr:ATP-binding protein [Cellulomonas bogoriensis]
MSATGGTTLRRRVTVALACAGLVVVLAVTGAVAAFLTVGSRQQDVTEMYFDALLEADNTFVRLVDAEASLRAYVATGDEVSLEPFEALAAGRTPAQERAQARLLERRGEGSAVLRAQEAAREATRAWYADHAMPTIEQVRQDGPGTVGEAQARRGQVLFEDVRVEVEAYRVLLQEERAAAVQGLRTATRVLAASVAALAGVAVVGGALLWVFLRKWVLNPLTALTEDVRLVAEGQAEHEVATHGTGEVAQVAQDVDHMRRRLVGLIAHARRSREELEESHARLREQSEDLARSNRDLEQFAYVASHDLQEPLRKVASFTQLLAKRYQGQLDERADQYIEFAVDGAKRMQRLINDLLGFSRVGRIGGELGEVDVRVLAERVVEDLDDAVREAGAQVVVGELPTVVGEEPLLAQLLHNLVGNAVKFRHPDRAPVVRLEARRTGAAWELSCSDNGIGIDEQYVDRVFVIFQRLHPKDLYEGTGIGLALCKKIVEYHGGQIWIDAGAAEGTTIRWTFPDQFASRLAEEQERGPSGPRKETPVPSGATGQAPASGGDQEVTQT